MVAKSPIAAVGSMSAFMVLFMLIETYKDVLLPRVWKVGSLLLVLSIASALVVYVSSSTVVVVIFVISVLHVIGAWLAFMTCTNKKGDLVLKRHIEAFQSHMKRLKAAEDRLRGALQAMQLADKDMASLQDEIDAANEKAKQDLAKIKRLNESEMEGKRRNLLTEIVELADVKVPYLQQHPDPKHPDPDLNKPEPQLHLTPTLILQGDKMYDEPERQLLFKILSNMAGLDPTDEACDARLGKLYAGLRLGEHALPEHEAVADTTSGALCMPEHAMVQVLDELDVLELITGMGDTPLRKPRGG